MLIDLLPPAEINDSNYQMTKFVIFVAINSLSLRAFLKAKINYGGTWFYETLQIDKGV